MAVGVVPGFNRDTRYTETIDKLAVTSFISSERLSKVSNILHRVLIHGLPGLYFLVTVSFYLRTYDSAQIKISLFQIGGAILFALWIIKVLIEGQFPFEKREWVYIAPFLGLLVSGLVSYAHAPYKAMSFDETTRRILYVALALIILGEFQTEESIRRLLRWILAAAVVTLFYGLIQYIDSRLFSTEANFGLDPFVWRGAFSSRIFSSFGNPNFFGNFLVLITPIFFAEYLKQGGPVGRPFLVWGLTVLLIWLIDRLTLHAFGPLNVHFLIYYQLGLVIVSLLLLTLVVKRAGSGGAGLFFLVMMSVLLINLYATDTKGAWVGFTAAVVVTITLVTRYFVQGDRVYVKKLLAVIAILVTLGSGTLLTYSVRRRMTSVNFRVFTWIATWEMTHTHPIFGAGIGSFRTIYPSYRRPEIITLEAKSNTETDHAEDEYLEVWNDEGIFGFGIYLWFLATVILSGLSGLRSLSSRKDSGPKKKTPLEISAAHPHTYDLLGYLAAFCGGLMHWFMDVSVRFVSSGIYFSLLPAMVVRLSEGVSMDSEPRHPRRERWIRLGVALFWFLVFLSFQIPLLTVFIASASFWMLSEALEYGLPIPARLVTAGAEMEARVKPLSGFRALAGVVTLVIACRALLFFQGFFLADLHHNVAIFFSKNSIWTRNPESDAKTPMLSPELQEEYRHVGGAIEEYEETTRLNPFFSMSRYFTGNVYNDWGSQVSLASQAALNRGDRVAAETLRDTARTYWEKALAAYQETRSLTPNYVQVHHQMGIIHNKMGEQDLAWGFNAEAEKQFSLAQENLELYREQDPVYLPNYAQLAMYYARRQDYDGLVNLYQEALHVYQVLDPRDLPDRWAEIYVNLAKAHYLRAAKKHPGSFLLSQEDDLKSSVRYFLEALRQDPMRADAVKGLALLYSRTGEPGQARPYWERLRQLTPQDPDLQAVFKPAPR
jgi:tetratricopeptide (TPR) repeat protein